MWVIPRDDTSPYRLLTLIKERLEGSRFTARLDVEHLSKRRPGAKITCVRLRKKKDYCGQHAGPCLVGGRHTRTTYLEGQDWVGFNNMINDLLDALHADCDVFSYNRESLVGRYYIRRRKERRVRYPYEYRGRFAHWTQSDYHFEDHCGKAPPEPDAQQLDGTPGYACHTPEAEALLRAGEDEKEDGEEKEDVTTA